MLLLNRGLLNNDGQTESNARIVASIECLSQTVTSRCHSVADSTDTAVSGSASSRVE